MQTSDASRLVEDAVWADLARGAPTFWINERAGQSHGRGAPELGLDDVLAAAARWRRFAPALAARFADSVPDGIIESPLLSIPNLTSRWLSRAAPSPESVRVFLKADHALPIAGSVKARGGIYEVLCVAERVALAAGLLTSKEDDYRRSDARHLDDRRKPGSRQRIRGVAESRSA